MSNKIDVYNLGQLGINRVNSPVQVKDGELLNCQNASVKPVQGQLALTKRDGMAKINSTAAAGTLLAINSIPIVDPDGVGQLYIVRSGTTEYDIVQSSTTFAYTAIPALQGLLIPIPSNRGGMTLGPGGALYFSITGGTVYKWDGTTLTNISGTPTWDQVYWLRYDNDADLLYVGLVADTSRWGVAVYNGTTWSVLGDAASLSGGETFPGILAVVNSTLYTYRQNPGRILRWTGTAWAIDATISTTFGVTIDAYHAVTDMIADGNNLYVLMSNRTSGATPEKLVFKRDHNGTWTNISRSGVSYGYHHSGGMYQGSLYVSYRDEAISRVEIWRYTGTTWTTDFDSIADNPTATFDAFINFKSWESKLLAGHNSSDNYFLVRSNGTWAHQTSTGGGNLFATGPQ